MKTFLNKHYFTLSFVGIFILIFVLGGMYSRYMTNQIKVHEDAQITVSIVSFERNYELATLVDNPYIVTIHYQNNQTGQFYLHSDKSLGDPFSGTTLTEKEVTLLTELVKSSSLGFDTSVKVVSYLESNNTIRVSVPGFHDLITVSVKFNSDFTSALSYSNLESSESYEYADGYVGNPSPAVENYYMDAYVAGQTTIDAIAGASYGTSPAMQKIINFLTAFASHQVQNGVTVLETSLEGVYRNFEISTLSTYPYIAVFTLSDQTQTILYLNSSFEFESVKSGSALPEAEVAALQGLVSTQHSNIKTSTKITSFDETEKTMTVETYGFQGVISVKIYFNDDYSAITKYDSLVSNESYEHSHSYTGGAVPAVELYYLDGLVNGEVTLDAVAGASQGTSPAMQLLVDLVHDFMNEQTGGN